MMTTYSFGICGIRWLTSPRDDATPVLQFARSPVNGGTVEWFNVPWEVASLIPTTPTEQQPKDKP